MLLGVVLTITGKDIAKNGNNFMNAFSFYKTNKDELEKSVAFAKTMIETAPVDKMSQSDSSNIPESEERFIYEAAKYHTEKREQNRVKYRNIGLIIMLISLIAIIYACSGVGMGVLAVLAAFVGFIGLLTFGSHLKPPAQVFVPKAKSGTKEIIKGAIIGGIVAGDVGAVVGATIAKNKLDNEK